MRRRSPPPPDFLLLFLWRLVRGDQRDSLVKSGMQVEAKGCLNLPIHMHRHLHSICGMTLNMERGGLFRTTVSSLNVTSFMREDVK
jgi:hypothetical protein